MLARRSQQYSWSRFTAAARRVCLVWAIVNLSYYGTRGCQHLTHSFVYGFQFVCGQQPFRHTPLVGDRKNAEARLCEQGDCLGDAWRKLHFLPAGYIMAFRGLAIDNPVTIQKYGPLHGIFPAPLTLR